MSGKLDPHAAATGSIAIALTGSCDGLEDLRSALRDEKDVELLGWSEQVREAAPMLAASHLQVVLHATRGTSLFTKELAAIREHTRAPIILLASRKSPVLLEAALESKVSDLLLLPQSAENVVSRPERRSIRAVSNGARWTRTAAMDAFSPSSRPKAGRERPSSRRT